MKISKQDQAEIRAYYPWYTLRFREDGSILAKPPFSNDRAWGLLYTPEQTAAHIKTLEVKDA
jgi:hypothetical protein